MSENTDYYAVLAEDLAEVRARLLRVGLTALVCTPETLGRSYRWVVVEAPTRVGWVSSGGTRTFEVLFDPWQTLLGLFPRLLHLHHDEADGWRLRIPLRPLEGLELCFGPGAGEMGGIPDPLRLEVATYLGLTWVDLERVLSSSNPALLCELLDLPYLELEDQNLLGSVLPSGAVLFSSDL